nr:MAG TPA: hypothetical protein [Caudoviricetes sp.]
MHCIHRCAAEPVFRAMRRFAPTARLAFANFATLVRQNPVLEYALFLLLIAGIDKLVVL